MDRRVLAAVIGVALLAAILLVGLLLSPDTGPPVEAPVSARPRPAPARPSASTRSAPERQRVAPPPGVEPPEPPDERPEAVRIGPDDKREMNYAMDGVLKSARQQCLQPWLDADPGSAPVEFVFDAVLLDGRLADFGLRSLGPEVPDDVLACVADAVWYGDWPQWELQGELRLQRSTTVEPSR